MKKKEVTMTARYMITKFRKRELLKNYVIFQLINLYLLCARWDLEIFAK